MEKSSFVELRNHFKTNGRVHEFQGHARNVHALGWNAHGQRLASGSQDKTVCIFQLDHGGKLTKEFSFPFYADSVYDLTWHAYHPDLLATASADKTVRVLDARARRAAALYPTKGHNISVKWSRDGSYIAVGNTDNWVTFIDCRAGKPLSDYVFQFQVNGITFNPNSDLFFIASGEGNVLIYEFPEMRRVHQVEASVASSECVEYHPAGLNFGVGSSDSVVTYWDAPELACIQTFASDLHFPVTSLSFNHDGSLIASASASREVMTTAKEMLRANRDLKGIKGIDISHVETGNTVAGIDVRSPTFALCFHPKQNILAFASEDTDEDYGNREAGMVKLVGISSS